MGHTKMLVSLNVFKMLSQDKKMATGHLSTGGVGILSCRTHFAMIEFSPTNRVSIHLIAQTPDFGFGKEGVPGI